MKEILEKLDPECALEALFPSDIFIGEVNGEEIYVKPLSLAHYALLEKVDSFLVSMKETDKRDPTDVIVTYYICTHDARSVMKNFSTIVEDSLAWAEHLPPCVSGSIAEAIDKQIQAMSKCIPSFDIKKKVVQMDS